MNFYPAPYLQSLRKVYIGSGRVSRGWALKEYTKGAFECLSWIEARMTDLEGRSDKWDSLRRELAEAVDDVRRGVGVDFRERLRALM